MQKRSKRYTKLAEKLKEIQQPLSLADAVKLLKQFASTKFDESVECVFSLGIDPRQAEQQIRGAIALPKGIGKKRRVIAFCEGETAEQAKAAGAMEVGAADLAKKIQDGWMDFDVALAEPKMMRVVGKLGRVLGPQGKMPSPKAGTVTDDIVTAVTEYSAGKLEYRNDDGGNLHLIVGKLSFTEEDLMANIETFIAQVKRVKPAVMRGTYIKKMVICSTMSPSIQVDAA